MIDQELVDQVTRLPARQRLELIELLTHSLHGELPAEAHRLDSSQEPQATRATEELAAIERLARSFNLDMPPDSSLHQLRGVISSDAVPTTKDAVRDLITDYLIEKHS